MNRPDKGRAAVSEQTEYDLIVLGAGSAGFAAAIRGAELGYTVAMVEGGTIGGTCVNVGCVPSKNLIWAMSQYHLAGERRFSGVRTTADRLNWREVIAQKERLVDEMRQSKYEDVLAAYPAVAYIKGRARLAGANGVIVDGRPYRARKIIVATGASPWAPPILGLADAGYLTSETLMALRERPDSLIILGGNAVGLELAQIFSRAGTDVTVLERLPHIAPFEEAVISESLAAYLAEEGMQIVTGFATDQVDKRDGRYYLTGRQAGVSHTFDADQLLVATGRRPNTDGLGLDEAGVQLGRQGEPRVDETLRTTHPDVYAAGDVLGEAMYVYVAAYGGSMAAENALTEADRRYDTRAIPRVTFTDPQIASTGVTEAAAREAGFDVQASVLSMSMVPRALAARDTRGLIKLVVDRATDRLLGAHVLAPEAGEVIQTAVLAVRCGLTASQLRETMFPYLTNVEGLKLAALALEKDVALLSCCAG